MNIGFDAKRAFLNRSGLGNYSRFVIQSLLKYHGKNNYFLFTPRRGDLLNGDKESFQTILPKKFFSKLFPSYWRTFGISDDIRKRGIEVYHGLSGELPHGLTDEVKTVVTIHDLIFLRYPEFYKPVDRKIYESKFKYACKNADTIIAISQQTKNDIIEYFGISGDKIKVIYQSCNQRFHSLVSEEDRTQLKEKYQLPENYLLYVGTIEERKNILSILKAIHTGKIETPLVIIGKPTPYINLVQKYIHENRIENIFFLSGVPDEDLPGIFQMAGLFIYPSVFEGFGIPILEALYSKVPVITSKGSCFIEAGGKHSIYTNPTDFGELAQAINRVLSDSQLSETMIEEGYKHALTFDNESISEQIMNIYKELVNE